MKDLKYLLSFIPILSVYWGFSVGGIWTFSGAMVAYLAIPFMELFLLGTEENRTDETTMSWTKARFFDVMLYLNLPLLFGLIFYFCHIISTQALATYELVGMTISLGIIIGSAGINVGHELGHRSTWYEQLMSKTHYLSALYMHFFIEHNRGHHKWVATDKDPASSKLNQTLFAFYWQSVAGGFLSAWKLENNRLRQQGKSPLSLENEMIWYMVIQVLYIVGMSLLFSGLAVVLLILAAIQGFLQLETVNYIEHYGLRRKKLANGRYEPVMPYHSWNSNHAIGRIVLYELTRHSDHHFNATRKYQVLRHFDESPQLPFGYPGSMMLATIPPLWFKVMNKRVEAFQERLVEQ